MAGVYVFEREARDDAPAGLTVSKRPELPEGAFSLTEWCWPGLSLWFVDADDFSADERQAAYESVIVDMLRKGGE